MTKLRLARRAYFSSAVKLYDPNKSHAENVAFYGEQVSVHGQGHNYVLEAYVEGPVDPRSGMLMTLSQLDDILKELTVGLDHKFLNYDVKYFSQVLPTASNLALYCHDFLKPLIEREAAGSLRLQKVRLYESEDLWVDCGETAEPEI